MPASRDTKKLLADTLRDMMETAPFEQITVTRLCQKCGVNRKSFYYHFKDKYDVINWIFDTGLEENTTDDLSLSGWVNLTFWARYFYENRTFYKKALEITGQNSFSEHFRNVMFHKVKNDYRAKIEQENTTDFQLNFFTDAIVMAFHRWLRERSMMTPEAFVDELWHCASTIKAINMEDL